MAVTVIVANYNQVATLPLVLASLSLQTEMPKCVIVADDGSSDDTCDWIDAQEGSYPFELCYTTDRHNGYGLTVSENRAASFVSTERVMFTNSDVIHAPGSIESHAQMEAKTVAGGVIREVGKSQSSQIDLAMLSDWHSMMKKLKPHLTYMSNKPYMQHLAGGAMYGVWGGNFSVDAAAFASVGGFNEDYRGLYGGEEADLIQRLMKQGCKLAWAYNSTALHLGHHARVYREGAKGNEKYRKEYL